MCSPFEDGLTIPNISTIELLKYESVSQALEFQFSVTIGIRVDEVRQQVPPKYIHNILFKRLFKLGFNSFLRLGCYLIKTTRLIFCKLLLFLLLFLKLFYTLFLFEHFYLPY